MLIILKKHDLMKICFIFDQRIIICSLDGESMFDYVLFEKYTKNISVLFIEDNKIVRKEILSLLDELFFRVDYSIDGLNGIEKYSDYYTKNNSYYDLVITDIKIPKLDGIELTKMVFDKNKEQKLIVLSAHSDSKYLMELVNIGISQFIKKPIEINNFLNVVFKICEDIFYTKNIKRTVLNSKIIHLSLETTWDKEYKTIKRNDLNVKLSKKELLFIDLLLSNSERTYTSTELISYIWKDEVYHSPDVKNLNNILSRLRKKLPEVKIENIYGLGYRIYIES